MYIFKMRENDILDTDVSLEELANLTKNYSGAEISGVVKAASSYAFTRHTKVQFQQLKRYMDGWTHVTVV